MPNVSIVKCSSYDKARVYAAIKKVIDDIGFRIKPGSKVILKPNVLNGSRPNDAVTTHPSVVEAVCRVLREKDCSIIIAESSGFTSTLKNYEVCGIAEVARRYDAKLVSLSSESIITKRIEGAKVLKETKVSKILFEADLIINLPKLKTHTLTKYTGAVKNLFGCIPGVLKQKYHVKAPSEKRFCNLIVDIYSLIMPELNIMDGIVGMEGDGPSGGDPKKIGLVIAADDAAALDLVVEKMIGLEGKVYTTRFAIARRLLDPDKVNVSGEIKKIRFRHAGANSSRVPAIISELIFRYSVPEPHVIKERCVRCGACAKVCYSKAIRLNPYPVFNRRRCIHCFCCHELCPYHTIGLKKKPFIEFLSKLKHKVLG
ncbi:hypothetical protein COV19_00330 [Candidatus Woesearchaeota archaeon CG10_big_fil_rev_8_21_14_0_10_44_13]|nr:MAG: hypothetical protein COV19_00330 [Candidatus Woesearchaeota archaeon CG10_big_fil_rev_8_21_14_0_10_44_13]